MYNYYRYKGVHHRLENIHNVSFRKVVPPFNSLHNILWHSFSLLVGARFYQYQIVRDGKVLSTAEVCPRLPIFAFINNWGVAYRTLYDNQGGTRQGVLPTLASAYH